ncbi:MAG: hypothetical protein IJ316_04090 [Clostridia bacterium]|nr:hypothetical protein [Clostridia bacterium]
MSWSKIKNIMIGILVLINVFLLIDIALTKYISSALPKGTGEDFVNVLKQKDITIEKALIPEYYEKRTVLTVELYSLDQLSQMFLGKKVGYTSSDDNVVATCEMGEIIVDGNYITFTGKGAPVAKNGTDILKAMKAIGISTEGAVYDEDDGVVKLVFDSVEVEGIYLDITLSEDGKIASAEGVWPKITIDGIDEKVSVITAVLDIRNSLPEGAHIADIEKTYIFECINNIPRIRNAWRISSQGKSYVVSG